MSLLDTIIQKDPETFSTKSVEVFRKLLAINGDMLKTVIDAIPELADDEQIIESASKTNDKALAFASKRLLKDPDFVAKVISKKPIQAKYVPKELFKNKAYVLKLIEANTDIYEILRRRGIPVVEQEDVVIFALEHNLHRDYVAALSPYLLNKINIAKTILANGYSVSFISAELKDNEEIAKLAIEKNANFGAYLSERLQLDLDLAKRRMEKDYLQFDNLKKNLPNYPELVAMYVDKCEYYPAATMEALMKHTSWHAISHEVQKVLSKKPFEYMREIYESENDNAKNGIDLNSPCLDFLLKATSEDFLQRILTSYRITKVATILSLDFKGLIEKEIVNKKIVALEHKDDTIKEKRKRNYKP